MFDKKFLNAYLDNLCHALEGNPGLYNMGLGAWTTFHMESILYPLAERLRPDGSGYAYKQQPCTEECRGNCYKNKGKCGYGTTWSQEYYRVDLGLYRYPDAQSGLWRPDYLIEHENAHFKLTAENGGYTIKKKGWFAEFIKLLPINCSGDGARVVISYSDLADSSAENPKAYEEFLLSVLGNETILPSLCERPILVLLGPSVSAVKKAQADFFYMMFEKNGTGWECESGFSQREDVLKIFCKLKAELQSGRLSEDSDRE